MEKRISEVLEFFVKSSSQDQQIADFEKASEVYEKLVDSGFAKKRGYNILTTEEIYLYSKRENCQQKV